MLYSFTQKGHYMTQDAYREEHCSKSIFDNLEKLEETLNGEFIEVPSNLSEAELLAWLNNPNV